MSDWFDIKVCLPYEHVHVLIAHRSAFTCDNGEFYEQGIHVGYLHQYRDGKHLWKLVTHYKSDNIFDEHRANNIQIVTHWMPLPDAPNNKPSSTS